MNQSTQREVNKARSAVASGHKLYAAATLASLHRCSSAKVQAEIAAIVEEMDLSTYMTAENGCLIAKEPPLTAAQIAGADSMMGAL